MSRAGSVKRVGSTWGFVVDVGTVRRPTAASPQARLPHEEGRAGSAHRDPRDVAARDVRPTSQARVGDLPRGLDGRAGDRRTAADDDRRLPTAPADPCHTCDRRHLAPGALGAGPRSRCTPASTGRGVPGGRGPLGNRTIRYVHMVLGKALSDAERKGLVQRNVARLATPPSPSSARSPEMKVWTPEQLRAFLEFSAASPHGPLLRVAAMTGLRRSELCGLRWMDVDFDRARLTVRQAITTVRHQPSLGDVKSTRSRRVVDLDPVTLRVLRSERARQRARRAASSDLSGCDSGLAFTMPDGSGWHPDVITRAFTRLVERSDLPRIRLHDLRHTHATHLLAAGTKSG